MLPLASVVLPSVFVSQVEAQTPWEPRRFWELGRLDDGRLEVWLRGSGYYGEGNIYPFTYRNSIEVDRESGALLVAFAVSPTTMLDAGHIMTIAVQSGETVVDPPLNATQNRPMWINDNMVLWYDARKKSIVMLYQHYNADTGGGEYGRRRESPWPSSYVHDGTGDSPNDEQVWKIETTDVGETWSEPVRIMQHLDGVEWPHVQYSLVESLDKDSEGFSRRVMIPVHRLDMDDYTSCFQMAVHTTRDILPDDGSWTVINMTSNDTLGQEFPFSGSVQASIVRPDPDSPFLVAFERNLYATYLRRTTSSDDGYTWTLPQNTPIPNPTLMAHAVALHSGLIMLIYNPNESWPTVPEYYRLDNSHLLVVSLSDDAGLTWKYGRALEYAYDSSFLYPFAIQDPTCDNIYLTYSVQTDLGDMSCAAFFDWAAQETLTCKAKEQWKGDFTLWPDCEASNHEKDTWVWSSQEQRDLAELCFNRTFTENFVKLTMLHESWIIDNHDWDFDHEGCTYEIPETLAGGSVQPESLRDEPSPEGSSTQFFSYMYSDTEGGLSDASLTDWMLIAGLGSAIVTILLMDCVLAAVLCWRRPTQKVLV